MTCRIGLTLCILATLFLVVLLSGVAGAQFYYTSNQFSLESVKVIYTSPLRRGPAVLQVTLLHNDTSTILEGVTVKLIVSNGRVLTPSYYFSYVYPLQLLTLRFVVNTSVNSEHKVLLHITWNKVLHAVPVPGTRLYRTGVVIRDVPDEQTIQTYVYIPGMPLITVRSSPSLLVPGLRDEKVIFYVCNNGSGTAYSVLASFTLQSPINVAVHVVNSSNIAVPYIEPGRCVRFPLMLTVYALSTDVESRVTFVFTITYTDEMGKVSRSTSYVDIPILSSGLVKIIPTRTYVSSGTTDRLDLRVCNLLPVKIANVTLDIISARGVIVNNTQISISELDPGTCRDVMLIVRAPRGIAAEGCGLTYLLSYGIGGGVEVVRQGSLVLSLLSMPEMKIVDIITAPKTPKVGELVSLSVRIINTGGSSAYNVNVSLSCVGLKPVSESYEFFGRLNPQDETIASFTLNASRPGIDTCRLSVSYTDPLGNLHVKSRVLKILVLKENSTLFVVPRAAMINLRSIALLAVALSVGIAVVVVVVVLIWHRRRT